MPFPYLSTPREAKRQRPCFRTSTAAPISSAFPTRTCPRTAAICSTPSPTLRLTAASTSRASATTRAQSPHCATSTRASVRARGTWWAGGATGARREPMDSERTDASVSETVQSNVQSLSMPFQPATATTRAPWTRSVATRTDSATAARTPTDAGATSASRDSGTFPTASLASATGTRRPARPKPESASSATSGPTAFTARSVSTDTLAIRDSKWASRDAIHQCLRIIILSDSKPDS
jgi:hypothetical protein